MVMKSFRNVLAANVAIACLIGAMAAQAADKPSWRDGRKVFKACQSCHSFKPGEHRFGPTLNRVIGKKAGTEKGFPYSKAMKSKGEAGLIWTEETLYAFLKDPRNFVPKTKMDFPGLKDAKDRRDVIAYVRRKAKR